ncbi:MAG: GAP family protein [Actinomycetota bacterium]
MGDLLSQILPLTFAAAISPTVLTVAVLVLSSKERPVARTVAYAVGCWIVLLVIGLPAISLFADASATRTPAPWMRWVDLASGITLLALGARRLARKPTPHEKQGSKAGKLANAGLRDYVVLGLALMITNFTTLVLYLPVLKGIARAPITGGVQLAVLLVCQVIILLPVLVPLLIRVLIPGPASKILGTVNAFTAKHTSVIMTVILLVFGVYLTAKGVSELN